MIHVFRTAVKFLKFLFTEEHFKINTRREFQAELHSPPDKHLIDVGGRWGGKVKSPREGRGGGY